MGCMLFDSKTGVVSAVLYSNFYPGLLYMGVGGGPENGDTSLCTFMHTHGGKHTFLLCVDRQQNR